MRKITLFTVLVFLFSVFNACEDEDVASLIGKWLFELSTAEYYEDNVLVGTETYYEGDIKYLEFFKGGTGTVWFDELENESFTWKKEGKTVTVDEGTDNEQVIKIKNLSQSTLKFSMTMEEEDGGVVYKIVMTMTMTKVED